MILRLDVRLSWDSLQMSLKWHKMLDALKLDKDLF